MWNHFLPVEKSGETPNLSCRGSEFHFTCCDMDWIKQPEGKALESKGFGSPVSSYYTYDSSLWGCLEISRGDCNSIAHLRLSSLKPDDSAKILPRKGRDKVLKHIRDCAKTRDMLFLNKPIGGAG